MNIKNNKRHQQTIETIERVFLQFLRERELSQIRVCDICREANINRSTFYANYRDVYDLADQLKDKLFGQVSNLLPLDAPQNASVEDFVNLFCHIQANRELYKFYFKLGYDQQLLPHFTATPTFDNREHLDYHITFFKHGFNAIIKQWLSEECKIPPEEMCQILLLEYQNGFQQQT